MVLKRMNTFDIIVSTSTPFLCLKFLSDSKQWPLLEQRSICPENLWNIGRCHQKVIVVRPINNGLQNCTSAVHLGFVCWFCSTLNLLNTIFIQWKWSWTTAKSRYSLWWSWTNSVVLHLGFLQPAPQRALQPVVPLPCNQDGNSSFPSAGCWGPTHYLISHCTPL